MGHKAAEGVFKTINDIATNDPVTGTLLLVVVVQLIFIGWLLSLNYKKDKEYFERENTIRKEAAKEVIQKKRELECEYHRKFKELDSGKKELRKDRYKLNKAQNRLEDKYIKSEKQAGNVLKNSRKNLKRG